MTQKKNKITILVVLTVILGILSSFFIYQSIDKSTIETDDDMDKEKKEVANNAIEYFTISAIGNDFTENPRISHIIANDLDNDKLLDVVVCDMLSNSVSWIRQHPIGVFQEIRLADNLIAPAHVEAIDFDEDGDKDIMVAVLGMLFPNNDKIGSVVILENDGNNKFKKHVIVDKIARVTDVRAGDLDGDGDKDLAVAQFGYDDGETRWIENLGNWEFNSHIIQRISGPLNVEIIDIDNDSDLDIISLVTQEWEDIYCFINDGKGHFEAKLIWGSNNQDFGSSGISLADINQDGAMDILYTNGDAFDYVPPMPRPWHGVQWLENMGNLSFKSHRICDFPGAFSARSCDFDKDNDMDILVVSGFNLWDKPFAESFIWLENDGSHNFTKHTIATSPTHLITMDLGDFDNNGSMDAVTGGMYVYPPYNHMKRLSLWKNNK
ncbi:VCBS repeat-containing protein [Tamlana fucoidanivorans]|uniref:VCBS repeat-containing protein n=1 Tax=Allotamlana fucoidanivorans TaxID=2583814 RepID=A0A5C4SL94_9FLAO|nr:VCBS repeat-containing protein [Tamlana fucoidanivorans]TNJ44666.1 VCBS repeat-containing protein [Tamlana fucoidanivorans]